MFSSLGYVKDELLVQIKPDASREIMQAKFASKGALVINYYDDTRIFDLKLSPNLDAKVMAMDFATIEGVKNVKILQTKAEIAAGTTPAETVTTEATIFGMSPMIALGGVAVLVFLMGKRRRVIK